MSRRMLLLAVPILALTLTLGMALGATLGPRAAPLAAPARAAAQGAATPGTPAARTIAVAGEGRVTARPDLAYAVVAIETSDADLAQAQRDNNARATAVLDALKARGIAEQDLQTIGFNIFPQNDRDGRQTGYRVSNRLRVTVRDVNALSDVLGEALAAGATGVQGISFDIANKDDALRRAREAAVADARAKAEQYARLAGAQLGAPLTIVEENASRPVPQAAGAAPAAQRGGDGPPLESGEGIVGVTVRVTYEMR
jgi:uncharacterized protein YggE